MNYYVAEGGGKYHRVNPITSQALCRGTVLCDMWKPPIYVEPGAKAHPVVCKRCAKRS